MIFTFINKHKLLHIKNETLFIDILWWNLIDWQTRGGSANVLDAADNAFMQMKRIVIRTQTAPADPRDPTQSERACVFLTVKPICCDTAVKRTEHARTVMSRLTLSVAWLHNAMMSLSALAGLFCPQPVRWQRSSHVPRAPLETHDGEAQPPILTYCPCPICVSLHAQLEPHDARRLLDITPA